MPQEPRRRILLVSLGTHVQVHMCRCMHKCVYQEHMYVYTTNARFTKYTCTCIRHSAQLSQHILRAYGKKMSRFLQHLSLKTRSVLQCVAVCCSVLQCAAVCCSVLQCAAVCCSVLQCAAVCCSVLQCAVVCCSVLQCAVVCCHYLGNTHENTTCPFL